MQIDAQKYLEEIERYEAYINNRIAEIYRLECLATKVTATLCEDKVQTSGASDKIGNIVAMIADEKNKLQKSVEHFFNEKAERIKLIEQLEDTLEYKIIHGRYIQYLELKEIAAKEHYSYEWIREVHTRALKNFQVLLNNLHKPIEVVF